LFAFLVLADQLSKYFAKRISPNHAFAFSLPLPVGIMYLIYALVLGGIIYYTWKNRENFSAPALLAWTLIFTGAICNVLERLVLGYVRDFIYITFSRWTGVYDLADFYIILGVLILLFWPKALGSGKLTDKNDI